MMSYPRNIEFAEFIKIFRHRYVYEDTDGHTLIAMTSDEALLLSKYLFRGIADWAPDAGPAGTGGLPGLGEHLDRFAERNIRQTDLELRVTDEDLRSLGAFLARGLAAVVLTLESAHAHEGAYCC
jgi:hypothetical protein